ncbi:hypothetical protein [Crocinitomix catalasitica]|uniref:hypothetical protein n=1 Tax=Crocinitomix catalasitica TaxID=184607 RepID=UPI000A3F4B11|nr:hypothetical protein [Crocinitomix catalasitica]
MNDVLKYYLELVDECERFDKKGKTVPYTSANGHMFSVINKEGQLGMRFSNAVQEKYFEKYKTSNFISHGSIMKGYILITDEMFADKDNLVGLLNESYDYVMSLEPK